jgi:hypothetical protein
MRSNRARKEPGELAANKNLKFEKQKNDTIKNFNKELYAAPTLANGNKEINGKTYYPVKFGYKYGKNDRYISEMYLFIPKIYNASENKMRGSWRSFDVVIDADKLYNIERNPYSGGFQAYEDEATLRENTNNALRQAFADVQRNVDYQKEQIEKEKNSPWKSNGMIAKREKYLKEAYKELKYFIMFYANYGKYPAWIISDNNGGDYPAKMAEDIPEGYIDRSIFAANLAAPGDVYLVTDTRKKPRKELDNVTALKKYDIRKFSGEELQKMQTDDPLLYEQIKSDINTPATGIKDIIKICREKVGKSSILFHSEPDVWNLRLTVRDKKVFIILNYNDTDSNKIKQSITFNFANLDPKIFWSVNADEVSKLADLIKVEPLKWFITSFYPPLNDVIDYSFDFSAKDLKYFDLLYLCDTNDGEWWNYGFIASIGIDEFTNILGDKIRTLYAQGADKYDDVLLLHDVCLYVISDGERGADFEQVEQPIPEITGASYSHNGFDAVKILNSYGLGRTAPAALYNNNAIMDCKGMRPTYRQLPDYSQFFAPANNATTLAGSGLTDTMQLIADTCRRNYKDCAKIAAHLKGDCKLQSAFNLWHWMRNNIKYEYDSEGKEEVRTPLRTWQDRKRGVDCDCLSVFAWCTLYNMGYNPMFELAAFNGKENYSHIYLNLDGIIIDRVWYIFNTRPPQVTKTALFGVDMTKELIGKLF